MKNRVSIRILSIAVLFPLLAGVEHHLILPTMQPATKLVNPPDQLPGPTQMAARDETVTGRVVRENEGKEIDVDASPCKGTEVVRFVSPYKKEVVGTIKCHDNASGKEMEYQKAVVTQKKPNPF
jgi:hypothetical protein